MSDGRRKPFTMTPEQREQWERDIAAIEQEKPELIRLARQAMAADRAMVSEVTELLLITWHLSGLTIEQLAVKAEVTETSIMRLFNRNGNPSLYTLHRLADALGKRLVITLVEK